MLFTAREQHEKVLSRVQVLLGRSRIKEQGEKAGKWRTFHCLVFQEREMTGPRHTAVQDTLGGLRLNMQDVVILHTEGFGADVCEHRSGTWTVEINDCLAFRALDPCVTVPDEPA